MPEPTLDDLTALWWSCVEDLTALLDEVPEEEWRRPTDLPGWDVRAVAAHVAHLESVLAGGPKETAEVPDLPHIHSPMAQFTEIGVVNRRQRSGAEITAEIREMTGRRKAALDADPPTDPAAKAAGVFGALGWSTYKLFRNRPLDVWMHEQDVRRAVGRPGNLDTPGGDHTTSYLLESLGFVLAKKAGAPEGTTVVFEVQGSAPVAAKVGDDGRGGLVDPPVSPTARVITDRESFLLRAGGRRELPAERFRTEGDAELAQRVVAALAVTP